MSFRLFIYYCALCGGWAAFLGWAFGRLISPLTEPGRAGIRGMALGLMVALGLGLVDAIFNVGIRRFGQVFMRVGVGILVGAVGGLIGGLLGQVLYNVAPVLYVFGWLLTGLLVGASISVFELLASSISKKDVAHSTKKFMKCMIGGTVGGLLGGIMSMLLKSLGETISSGKDSDWLWHPTAMGFVALGMCIGLLVAMAQVILKEAWIKVEAGFKPGREMILSKEQTAIGRAEGSDIALFGDMGVEKAHANIHKVSGRFFIEDGNTPGGTFVNDQPARGRVALKSGDLIRVGKSLLRFFEKQKR